MFDVSEAEERLFQRFVNNTLDQPTQEMIQQMKERFPFAYYKLAGICSQFGNTAALWAVQMLSDVLAKRRERF